MFKFYPCRDVGSTVFRSSAKFEGMRVERTHVLKDRDIIELGMQLSESGPVFFCLRKSLNRPFAREHVPVVE